MRPEPYAQTRQAALSNLHGEALFEGTVSELDRWLQGQITDQRFVVYSAVVTTFPDCAKCGHSEADHGIPPTGLDTCTQPGCPCRRYEVGDTYRRR